MGYYKGANYLRANDRWFGYPRKEDGQTVPALSSITDETGTYYWAPMYDTRLTVNLNNLRTPYETITGYTSDNNTIKIYQVAAGLCSPKIGYKNTTPLNLAPGATFEQLNGGNQILNATNEPILMTDAKLNLLVPYIETYAITCTMNGAYSNYKCPIADELGRDNFISDWQSSVGLSFPQAIPLVFRTMSINWGNPITLYPTYYTEGGSNYNYMDHDKGFSGNYSDEVLTIKTRNCYNSSIQFGAANSFSTIYAGQMLQDTDPTRSPEYKQSNATHFQLVFKRYNSSVNGEQFWGILSVITTASLQKISLNG